MSAYFPTVQLPGVSSAQANAWAMKGQTLGLEEFNPTTVDWNTPVQWKITCAANATCDGGAIMEQWGGCEHHCALRPRAGQGSACDATMLSAARRPHCLPLRRHLLPRHLVPRHARVSCFPACPACPAVPCAASAARLLRPRRPPSERGVRLCLSAALLDVCAPGTYQAEVHRRQGQLGALQHCRSRRQDWPHRVCHRLSVDLGRCRPGSLEPRLPYRASRRGA